MHEVAALITLLLTMGTNYPANNSTLRIVYFHSHIFGNNRLLRLLLPPGYDLPANVGVRYPVLYLNDGQDLFAPATSTFHNGSWLLADRMDALYANGAVPPMIIVGIDNAGHRMRPNEYLPWPDVTLRPAMPHPHGNDYPAFIAKEVMPYVQTHFRVREDAQGTGIGGASYGAQIAAYAAARLPGRFGRLLIESPSVYADNYHLIRVVQAMRSVPDRISIGVGTNENGSPSCVPGQPPDDEMKDVLRLRDALSTASHKRSVVLLNVVECAKHIPPAFGARFPVAMKFLYGGTITVHVN